VWMVGDAVRNIVSLWCHILFCISIVLSQVAKCIDVDGGIFENVLYYLNCASVILLKLCQLCHLNSKYQ
jgi:hypothetical protein